MGTPVVREVLRLSDYVQTLGWRRDGGAMAAGSLSGELVVLQGDEVTKLPEHPMGVLSLDWHPSASTLASGGQDATVRLWGEHEAVARCAGWVHALAWSPNGSALAAATGNVVTMLELDGTLRWVSEPLGSTVTSLVWSPDGQRLIAGAYGGLWCFEPNRFEVHRRFEWKGAVLTLAIAPTGKWVASGNQDNSVHCWRLWSGSDLQMAGYDAKIEHIAWDHGARYLAVGGIGEITIWDFSGRGPQGSTPITLSGHARRIVALAYRPGPDARRDPVLMSAGADGRLCWWRPVPRGKSLLADTQVGEELSVARWSPDGSTALVAGADGGVFTAMPMLTDKKRV